MNNEGQISKADIKHHRIKHAASSLTDGGFRGRHDFMKFVLARKVAADVGEDMVAVNVVDCGSALLLMAGIIVRLLLL